MERIYGNDSRSSHVLKDRGSGTPHPHPFLPRHGGETILTLLRRVYRTSRQISVI